MQDIYRNDNFDIINSDENKELMSIIFNGISYQLKYENSDFIEFTIDNIWSPFYNNSLNELK